MALPPDLQDAFERLVDALDQSRNSLDGFSDELARADREDALRQQKYKQREQEIIARQEKLAATFKDLGARALGLASSMTTPEGAFQAMGGITASLVKGLTSLAGSIPIVGGAIKGLGEAGAEAIKLLTNETGKAFAVFGKISGSGVVRSFQETRESVERTGLTFEQLGSALTRNSEALASLSGSAISGSRRLQDIIGINAKAARELQTLGIGFQEFAEIQSDYVAYQARTGLARGKSDRELAAGAKAYAEELTVLARLTGKSREEQQKAQKQLENDARYRAMLFRLESDGRGKVAEQIRQFLTTVSPDQLEGWKETIGAGGIVGKAGSDLGVALGQAGLNLEEMAKNMLGGSLTARQANDMLNKGARQFLENTTDLTKAAGEGSPYAKFTVGFADRLGMAQKSQEDLLKTETERVKQQQKEGDATSAAMNKAQEVANQMQLLATSTKALMTVNNLAGDAMLGLIKVINELSNRYGDKVNEATEGAVNSVREGVKGFFGRGARRRVEGQQGAPSGAPAGAVPSTSTGISVGTPGVPKSSTPQQGSHGDQGAAGTSATGTSPEEQVRLAGLKVRPTGDVYGGGLLTPETLRIAQTIQSNLPGFRMFTSLNDKFHREKYPTSRHAQGKALDFVLSGMPTVEEAKGFKKMLQGIPGVHWVGNEYYPPPDGDMDAKTTGPHFHVQAAANGAVIPPRSGGTLVQVGEAGQSEAIVPLPDGRSIPVAVRGEQQQSAIMRELFVGMMDRLDTVVDLLDTGNKYSRNIAENLN